MNETEKERILSAYEKDRRLNQPSRRTLEFFGLTIAPREEHAAKRSRITCNHRSLTWSKWLKIRWRIERKLLCGLVDDLAAKDVPQNVIAAALGISPVTVNAWLKHRDEKYYLKKHSQRVEDQIVAVLEQCPESKLYKGGGGRTPRREFAKMERQILDKIRFALSDSPELYEELKEYL